MIRARFLFAVVVVADLTIILGGIPLLRDTYLALSYRATDATLLLQLLVANLALLLLVIAAMFACGMLGARAMRGVIRYGPTIFAQPIRARRTRYPQ